MNFLQKGLSSLESRLDKVLLDESDLPPNPPPPQSKSTPPPPPSSAPPTTATRSASPAPRRSGEIDGAPRMTMQERLAAAVAKKAATGGGSATGTRSASPTTSGLRRTVSLREATPRGSVDSIREPAAITTNGSGHIRSSLSISERPSVEVAAAAAAAEDKEHLDSLTLEELKKRVLSVKEDLTVCEMRRQEEVRQAAERVEALEEKVKYLAKEAASEARARAEEADSGGLERKLAEKDEKIALLIEEGEAMSRNELKLQNTIKRLRGKVGDEEKHKGRIEKAEREAEEARKRVRELEERVKKMGSVEEDLEKERKSVGELKEMMDKVQGEAALKEEKFKVEVESLKHELEREVEKSKATKTEWLSEQAVMESKMESLRVRLEEANSGGTGDAHAKLLRQMETWNMKYVTLNENSQAIQISLESRVKSLEAEKDELAKKEGDVRKRAREMSSKIKALESEHDTALSTIKDLESKFFNTDESIKNLLARALAAESALSEAETTFLREKDALKHDHLQRLEEERQKWESEMISHPGPPSHQNSSSLALNLFPSYGSQQNLNLTSRPTSPSIPSFPRKSPTGPMSSTESHFLGFQQRRASRPTSTEPPRGREREASTGGFQTPPVLGGQPQDEFSPPANSSSRISLPLSPSDAIDEPPLSSSYFEGVLTPSSPLRHPDIVSVSTIAAGPSVQLVERMSATVRRLESEMAGAREDLARVTEQRGEARKEIVELMEEVKGKREAEEKAKEAERKREETERRMEVALEMLGEKTELVEELRQDVEDLKAMYRELVEKTVK